MPVPGFEFQEFQAVDQPLTRRMARAAIPIIPSRPKASRAAAPLAWRISRHSSARQETSD